MIKVNINPGASYTAIAPASQYDVGRELIFTIYDGSSAALLPSGAQVTMVGTKPSGLGFTTQGTISGNQVTVVTNATMTEEAGHIPAELRFSYNGNNIGTANFIFAVEGSPHTNDTTDGDAETARDLMTRAEDAVTEAESAAQSAAASAARAEEAAAGAGLDATGAGANQVPTADGNGNWSWQDQQGGGGASSSDDVSNESDVSGSTVTDALNALSDQIANIEENTQEIGTLTIKDSDGTSLGTYNGSANTQIVLPASGGGSTVTVTQTLTSGTEIGSITVDGTTTELYAPAGGSSGGETLTWDTIADVDFSQTNGAQNFEYSNLPSYTKIVIVTFTPVSSATSDSRAMVTLNNKTPASNDLFKIYKDGTTYYTNNIVMEYDGKFWWISRNEDRNTSDSNGNGGYGTWKKWLSPIETGVCTYLKLYCLAAPVSGSMHIYGGK